MEGRREGFSCSQTFGSFAIGPVNSRRLIPVIQARQAWNVPTAADHGADAVVDLADDGAVDAGLAAAAPGGYDVILTSCGAEWPLMR
jgi:NADPH:quinone reductase-like Zn-dependent oxidoreductase